MDWFSWLSKTGLEPSLVYEYGLCFAHNELEEEDTLYFNHEFLQSMGISIAKHRLEILKLAKKQKGMLQTSATAKLIVAIKKTKRCFAQLVKSTWTRRGCHEDSSSALAIVPRPSSGNNYGGRFRGAMMMKRSKRVGVSSKQELVLQGGTRLLLTNGTTGTSPLVVYDVRKEEKMIEGDDDEGYWSTGVEEIRWDTMFQDLKPT